MSLRLFPPGSPRLLQHGCALLLTHETRPRLPAFHFSPHCTDRAIRSFAPFQGTSLPVGSSGPPRSRLFPRGYIKREKVEEVAKPISHNTIAKTSADAVVVCIAALIIFRDLQPRKIDRIVDINRIFFFFFFSRDRKIHFICFSRVYARAHARVCVYVQRQLSPKKKMSR